MENANLLWEGRSGKIQTHRRSMDYEFAAAVHAIMLASRADRGETIFRVGEMAEVAPPGRRLARKAVDSRSRAQELFVVGTGHVQLFSLQARDRPQCLCRRRSARDRSKHTAAAV
jgi:hypothetical protein